MKKNRIPIFAVFAAMVGPTAAQAQNQASVPLPSREEVQPDPVPNNRNEPKVQIDSSGAMEVGACPLSDSDVRTSISQVVYTGRDGSALPPEIALLLSDVGGTGADQPIKVVCNIRDRANAALRGERYVAAVQIPSQRIDDGVLRLEVITARIVEMRVRGDAGPYEALLQQRIEALKQLDPLNEGQAERILLLAGDVPGLDVRLALRPTGIVPGEVIGEMTVDYRRTSVIGNVQNYNSRQLGRETAYLRGEIYGLTGAADITYLGVSSTADFQEQQIGQIGHSMGLDQNGTRIGANFTYALSKPDLGTVKLNTRSLIANIEISRPLLRSTRTNFNFAGGFEYIDQRTRVKSGNTSIPLNLDRLTTFYLGINGGTRIYNRDSSVLADAKMNIEFRKGLDLFGATKTGLITPGGYAPSRFEGDAKGTVIRGVLSNQFNLGKVIFVGGTLQGQWSDRPLLNYDEFSVGNLTIGRGYDPGANSGDRALGGSVEVGARIIRMPKLGGEVFGFYDSVRIWNLDTNSTEDNRRLSSYGGGMRFTLPGSMRLEVTYAKPQDKALSFDEKRPPARVLFSLTAQLVPFVSRR